MTMKLYAALLLALAIAGCASEAQGPIPSTHAPDVTAPPLNVVPEGLVRADLVSLMEQAATDTGVPIDEIQVITAEAVTWSDGSLGCPEEGQMYTQALVPGYRVVLDVAGEELAYHASDAGDFKPCANPIQPVEEGRVDS